MSDDTDDDWNKPSYFLFRSEGEDFQLVKSWDTGNHSREAVLREEIENRQAKIAELKQQCEAIETEIDELRELARYENIDLDGDSC